ncbi:hypothetical protein PN465_08885 [Nodularia spumigena CS-584]|jgi:hypothetical protein|uniref:Uncharacterized protein n=2 Tax=Nodularia spumigena TaxID=70799 RepID=A0A2S0Q6D4_NODSP|nr:hypothetical protein [Nodularia spumigena]AHJ29920.1 hypothetical protein NSP_36090 [Nodularia spumigena CCY9414]AVZ29902.1 hypothetical protein BMF81_00877 [Nodularia spumigena UHCC 0039]EAW45575.1 hypothetical protein N9414_22108 [Nodularia spumigena CCY9414]MDB9382336.1 hypothetical protein [Nodularia spumigena CS-584]MEA5524309.1 hypothetical protein [Nodularia spumigena UHCC 0143]
MLVTETVSSNPENTGNSKMEDKTAYQESMEARFSELGAKIDQLQAKAEQAPG